MSTFTTLRNIARELLSDSPRRRTKDELAEAITAQELPASAENVKELRVLMQDMQEVTDATAWTGK